MKIWLIIVLVIILIVGLIMGIWGFISAFDIRKKENKDIRNSKIKNKIKSIEELQKEEFILFDQIYSLPKKNVINGIYSLYVGPEIDENEFFIPIRIFKSEDIIKSIKYDANQLKKAANSKIGNFYDDIIEYMREKNKDFDDLRWTILITNLNKKTIDEQYEIWLDKTKSSKRGFNK